MYSVFHVKTTVTTVTNKCCAASLHWCEQASSLDSVEKIVEFLQEALKIVSSMTVYRS